MFTLSLPCHIVGAKTVTIAKGKTEIIGKEGLFGTLRPLADGMILSAAFASDHTSGYQSASGTEVAFADTGAVYNGGSDAAKVTFLLLDTI